MEVVARVRRFVAQHRLFGRETRVVVAVSGGSDSVALALMLCELSSADGCRIAGVAHFNHQLRETADRDEQFTLALADSLGCPATVGRDDVARRARRERRSLEDAAHASRHEFFARARAQLDGDVVALGHTRDDQAETFLLRLLRGAGPKGLAAMHPRHDELVRPLLDCRRHELRSYLASRGVAYVDDESNADVSIPRNRVRAELLPLLERQFNPAIVDVLADEAAIAREVWQWMEDATSDERLHRSSLDARDLLSMPTALRRLVLWRAMREVSGGRHVAFRHVDAGLELLGSTVPASVDGPGCRVERLHGRLVLTRRTRRSLADARFDLPLAVPGEVALPGGGIVAAESSAYTVDPKALGANAAAIQRNRCVGQLRVRNRRPGDRFRPLGLAGRKKLQDYFVDRKVDRRVRDSVPLVVDEMDRIVWVGGFGIDEAFRVTDPAQAVLILRLKLPGGPR